MFDRCCARRCATLYPLVSRRDRLSRPSAGRVTRAPRPLSWSCAAYALGEKLPALCELDRGARPPEPHHLLSVFAPVLELFRGDVLLHVRWFGVGRGTGVKMSARLLAIRIVRAISSSSPETEHDTRLRHSPSGPAALAREAPRGSVRTRARITHAFLQPLHRLGVVRKTSNPSSRGAPPRTCRPGNPG